MGSDRLNDLFKVTQQVSGTTRISALVFLTLETKGFGSLLCCLLFAK